MSFTAYRSSNSRSNSITDDGGSGAKDLKSSIRESRLIQPEQWDLPEIQQIFEKVKKNSKKNLSFYLFI